MRLTRNGICCINQFICRLLCLGQANQRASLRCPYSFNTIFYYVVTLEGLSYRLKYMPTVLYPWWVGGKRATR